MVLKGSTEKKIAINGKKISYFDKVAFYLTPTNKNEQVNTHFLSQ
jgi:hypothetical protein